MLRTTATLLLLTAACTDSAPPLASHEAELTEHGNTGPADRAWYQSLDGLSYEALRDIDGVARTHHLDITDYGEHATFPIGLVPGRTYVDGPAVNGRGSFERYLSDGVLVGAFPRPWIDLGACDGDIWEGAPCVMADRVEVTLDALADDRGRIRYRGWLPNGEEVSGSVIVQRGIRLGAPE